MSFLADKDYSAIVAYAESFTSDESDVLPPGEKEQGATVLE